VAEDTVELPAPGAGLLYDCHCHLHGDAFDRDRPDVIQRARASGVRRVLTVAEDLDDAWRLLQISERHRDFIVPALGIHPDRAPLINDAEVSLMEELIRKHSGELGAIGEVGLDHRPCWDEKARDRQKEVFRFMIGLAGELDLPLSVHSRGAGREAIEVLESSGAERACLHAFDARAVHGERGARAGYLFSLGPSIVRSRVKQKLAPRLPDEALLLETDSPVLGPDPRRRNEPANLGLALKEISHLRSRDPGDLAAVIAENTARLFPRLVTGPGSVR